jgi:hypothetical protein
MASVKLPPVSIVQVRDGGTLASRVESNSKKEPTSGGTKLQMKKALSELLEDWGDDAAELRDAIARDKRRQRRAEEDTACTQPRTVVAWKQHRTEQGLMRWSASSGGAAPSVTAPTSSSAPEVLTITSDEWGNILQPVCGSWSFTETCTLFELAVTFGQNFLLVVDRWPIFGGAPGDEVDCAEWFYTATRLVLRRRLDRLEAIEFREDVGEEAKGLAAALATIVRKDPLLDPPAPYVTREQRRALMAEVQRVRQVDLDASKLSDLKEDAEAKLAGFKTRIESEPTLEAVFQSVEDSMWRIAVLTDELRQTPSMQPTDAIGELILATLPPNADRLFRTVEVALEASVDDLVAAAHPATLRRINAMRLLLVGNGVLHRAIQRKEGILALHPKLDEAVQAVEAEKDAAKALCGEGDTATVF